eukprot:19594-Heterococcus_DN1.PRE.3
MSTEVTHSLLIDDAANVTDQILLAKCAMCASKCERPANTDTASLYVNSVVSLLNRYAQIAQENGLVPIVEPEVTLGEGSYSIERTAFISEKVNSQVMRWLNEYNVCLDAILLKVMKRTIPPAVPGIHFLSGGMSAEESTLNLQALQKEYPNSPWSLTFSYGRALQKLTYILLLSCLHVQCDNNNNINKNKQSPTLKTWQGKPENKAAAQDMLMRASLMQCCVSLHSTSNSPSLRRTQKHSKAYSKDLTLSLVMDVSYNSLDWAAQANKIILDNHARDTITVTTQASRCDSSSPSIEHISASVAAAYVMFQSKQALAKQPCVR